MSVLAVDNSFVLNPRNKPYSRAQKQLFELIPQDGKKINSIELAKLRQEKFDWEIEFPRIAIIATMKSLSEKVSKNREPFRIRQTKERQGPYPTEYWIEPVK